MPTRKVSADLSRDAFGFTGFTTPTVAVVDTIWRIQDVGDFNGDGLSDLLWRNINGDTGWRLTIEPQTPDLNIGMFGNEGGEEPCVLRASVFMDYGQIYLLDPQPGMKWRQEFWGAGLGFTATIGNHLNMRVAVAFPLISDTQTYVGDMHCYFAIGAQF